MFGNAFGRGTRNLEKALSLALKNSEALHTK
jgi:hypothetical protein